MVALDFKQKMNNRYHGMRPALLGITTVFRSYLGQQSMCPPYLPVPDRWSPAGRQQGLRAPPP